MLNRKTIIVFIAALTIATIGILYITEKWIFDSSIKIYAFADDPTGISTTSTIQINGYQIGKVTSLEIIDNKVLFELSIKNEIGIKQNSNFYSVFESISGSKKIAIQPSSQESDNYENGDTINSLIIFKSLKETFDPDDEFEPKLKELIRTVGTALLEYGNSDINSQTQKLDFFCANKKAEKGNTQLKENIEKLLKLENNYQAVDFGKITIKESNLINRFVNYVTHLDSVTNRINMTQNFNESIIEINFSNIKGIKEISSKLYPRARIKEYIFTSTDCAKKFLNNLDKILKTENDWYHIEKSPSSIYQHDNKIYFIISGGWYMKSFYKEIVNELNNPSDNNK